MNADTITIERMTDILAVLTLAADAVSAAIREAKDGSLSTQEAAADMREIAANVKAALAD